ncbi:hypothetical protein Tco_0805507 [Tanacetum coccineum]
MSMHEVVHEMVVGECHEPNSKRSGSAWKAYMNERVAGLFLLVLLEYPNGNSQVKDNKIDLPVQQYEQFTIHEEESIDNGFASFNTIITSLKALDEGKKERVKSIPLKAKKESSDNETSTFGSDDEENQMAVWNFKKFFRRKGKFVRQPRKEKKSFRQRMIRKAIVIGNSLDAVIRIISLANVQSFHETKIKRHLLEVVRAIAKIKSRTKPTMKLVSWLNRQMR